MTIWNFDLGAAPRGKFVVKHRTAGKADFDTRQFAPDRIILATKCGKVTNSHYLPDEKRWLMLHDGEQPVAWMHRRPGVALPDHPHSLPTLSSEAANSPAETSSPPSGAHSLVGAVA